MKINLEDTIASVATPMGVGGIGIIRISGKDAINIIKKIFVSKYNKNIDELKSHTITHGKILDNNNQIIDEVLLSYMKAPKTYTCEDIIEINCHGGIKVTQMVLEIVLKNGARLADNGEFTKRAFLNGRIDLSQAEAVIDIINANTELSQKSAVNRLDGTLFRKISEYRNDLLTMIAHIEASIDYPEHSDEMMTYSMITDGVNNLLSKVTILLNTANTGRIIKEGIKTVILGRPNVGKSSILNKIIKEDRAIVTDIAGTTRDVLLEHININGIALNIVDTAGIRETDDVIEKIGVKKSMEYAEDADLIFMVLDGSYQLLKEDLELLEFIKNKKIIVLINKVDLDLKIDLDKVYTYIDKKYIIKLSAKTEFGFDDLYLKLKELFFNGSINVDEDTLITNERNKNSIYNGVQSLKNVLKTIENSMPEDFISMDLIECYKFLGEVIGDSVEEDVIDKIFSEFCLGK